MASWLLTLMPKLGAELDAMLTVSVFWDGDHNQGVTRWIKMPTEYYIGAEADTRFPQGSNCIGRSVLIISRYTPNNLRERKTSGFCPSGF